MNATEIIPIVQSQHIAPQTPGLKIMPLALLFARFIKATSKRSKHTARAYQKGVSSFLQFLGEMTGQEMARPTKDGRKTVWEIRGDTTPLVDIDLGMLDDFALWLDQQGVSQATINNRLAAVNSFMRVALRDKVITRDQGIDLGIQPYKSRQTREQQTTGRRLTPEEVRALRTTVELRAKADIKTLRDKAIIDLMLFAGLRRSEVAGLDVTDIRQDGGRFFINVTGKGKKKRRIKVHDTLFNSIDDWLKKTGRELGNGDNGPVFYNLQKSGKITDNRLADSVVGRLVADYGADAGLTPREAPRDENDKPIRGILLGPHDLRRTAARTARVNGAPLEKVQAMLGHSDIATTMIYIGEFEDDADTAIDYIRYTA